MTTIQKSKYVKFTYFLFIIIGISMALIPWLTHDVTFIVYVDSSLFAVLVGWVSIIIARVLSDKTSTEIKGLERKIDEISKKLGMISSDDTFGNKSESIDSEILNASLKDDTSRIRSKRIDINIIKQPLVIGLIILSVVEAVIMFLPLDYSKILSDDKSYKFLTDIILVSIPVIGGAITSKWITNSWQKSKERNEIKMRILAEFTESLAKKATLLGEFVGRLYNLHLDPSAGYEKGGSIHSPILFPKNDDEKPYKKYAEKWEQFEDAYWKLTYPSNNFFRSFRFYYTNSEINDKIFKVNENMDDVYHRSSVFFHSRNLQEFQSRYDDLQSRLKAIVTLLIEVESSLIKNKIKIR